MAVLGLLLIAIGAILAFGINVLVDEVDLVAIGVILMGVGAVGFVAGMLRSAFGFRTHTERAVSADGRHVIEEHHSSTSV
ncbi:MAG TPA: DUF6458 family protein [Acidimicrobiia bacterium]